MTHTEFYNSAVDRTRLPEKERADRVEIMLGVIAESLAAIADSLESVEGSLESMSDKMWDDSDL
jgi:hypothetical protein